MAGTYNGSRCCENASIRESLAGMMCCSLETLGIVVGQKQYHMSRWLGEGTTSNVYVVIMDNIECAAKVAKPGYTVFMDVRNLEKLQGIKGIPTIVLSDSHSIMLSTPLAKQFSKDVLCEKEMDRRLGELVDTLQCAHSRGIVNRDIRTENILVAEDQFLIVDWGYATSSNEPGRYPGTVHFASTRVLKMLEEGQHTFSVKPSDDLVSLVRSLYALTRFNSLRVQKSLIDLSNDDFADIHGFWETAMKDNSQWEEAEIYATQGDYAALKRWIQRWSWNW